jgi:hypothetical protein
MELRKPLFFIALGALVLCVLLDLGSSLLMASPDVPGGAVPGGAVLAESPTPGRGIPYLVLIDGLLLLTLGLMGASLLIPERVHGRLQGGVTLVGALVALGAGITMLTIAITFLLVMVALLTAVPFGTLAYLAIWGHFDRSGAAITLGFLMTFKVAAGVCLALAHPRFLQNKGLVLLYLTSLLATALVSLLHGWVPRILVSITDTLGGIIVAILGLIWAVALLIGALVSLYKAFRTLRIPVG